MTPRLPQLPELHWTSPPGEARYDASTETLTLTAAAGVDWINDALGAVSQHNATALGFATESDFSLSARINVVSPRTTFDAGALVLWADVDHWAKLCFEYSPQGEAMVVSVVTNGYSDDCNSTVIASDFVYLRISRVNNAWAFHFSGDGNVWAFVRLFRLDTDRPVTVGFLAQAPTGNSCVANFDHVRHETSPPTDLRDGS
jgi:uncharacterized protein